MTNEDAIAELTSSLDSYYGADERAVRFAIEALRKLQRFEEREPLVRRVVEELRVCDFTDANDPLKAAGDAVRNFSLLPPRG